MPTPTEDVTRKQLIDPQLKDAGWKLDDPSQVRFEIPVDGSSAEQWEGVQHEMRRLRERGEFRAKLAIPSGISDYALYRTDGQILAIVEAKRTSVDVRLAEAQARFYVEEIEKRQDFRPFAFLANGRDIYFYDVGEAPKRLVHAFFPRTDLEHLLWLRQNRQPLALARDERGIAGRLYQQEAIRRVTEAFDAGKRRALMVMATGTGKTRTAMALVDIFLRTHQARKILFVADRDALVKQALDEGFKAHIPDEPAVRLVSQQIDRESRLYVVTLQTLARIFRQFSPSFFDLIIFDEVHRSIFNRWNEPLQYFDARLIGLTATPAEFIDRNTFLTFDCHEGIPTALYPYRQAVNEGYLVDYQLYQAQSHFQRQGIHGAELTEEQRNQLLEEGRDPDEIDYSGSDLERKVTNRDTIRQQWAEFLQVCRRDESGQWPGKTIVFAITQDHALRLKEVWDEMALGLPEGFVQVITHKSDYKGLGIEQFKKNDLPRIAISVDMLETGVNVPEVVNLVFMRPVHSRIKLEQMIGRGTRPHEACKHPEWLPNGRKRDFLIVDFWQNDFDKTPQQELAQSLPVLVTLFNTRLDLLTHFRDRNPDSPEMERLITVLRQQIEAIPTDSILVKPALEKIEEAREPHFWEYLSDDKLRRLREHVSPMLRYASSADVQADTFRSKVERLKRAVLRGEAAAGLARDIATDVDRMPSLCGTIPRMRRRCGWGCVPTSCNRHRWKR